MRLRIGSRNAAVLPVPVSAQPIRSSPFMTNGMTALWIGVVALKAADADALDQRRLEAERVEGDRAADRTRPEVRVIGVGIGRGGLVPGAATAAALARAAAASCRSRSVGLWWCGNSNLVT